jgi:hypothetical protein
MNLNDPATQAEEELDVEISSIRRESQCHSYARQATLTVNPQFANCNDAAASSRQAFSPPPRSRNDLVGQIKRPSSISRI